ncbi:aliphatic amidase amie [hydrocarbon metagenome]|uniref:Aliphatic amidase amie n=1 Tax=hydrocarbon metagenome TaxID=938273 RepID=A0A0W8FWL8_9ZZZZ
MKISLFQYSPEWENVEENISIIESILTRNVADEEIIIFPEMTLTGFTMESKKFAEEIDGTGTKYFISLSQRLKKHIFTGIIERDEDKIYNSLVHFDDYGLIRARYRKIHPFSYAKENQFYDAANETVSTKIDQTKIGLTICYDLRFPELYRLYGKERNEIIINIANWPIKRIEHWKHLLKSRAIENQCYMIGVNRIGSDPFNEYNGASAVFDPMGEEVLMCPNEEGIFRAEIDLTKVEEVREKLPFLDDIKLL